mmetsp:Transcript_21488/g.52952  ORF Transcript_21488/g.52952 Transcript_21488/m.52952 type:complete len:113 (+) Transcript_21488:657-995(+)
MRDGLGFPSFDSLESSTSSVRTNIFESPKEGEKQCHQHSSRGTASVIVVAFRIKLYIGTLRPLHVLNHSKDSITPKDNPQYGELDHHKYPQISSKVAPNPSQSNVQIQRCEM